VYSTDRLAVLYEGFRHKIAHVTQPYGVFDTHKKLKNNLLRNKPQQLITWRVNATNRHPAIDIVPDNGKLTERPPWPVTYSHRCIVSIYRLKVDIPKSALGTGGYLENLKIDPQSQGNFEKCMQEFFP